MVFTKVIENNHSNEDLEVLGRQASSKAAHPAIEEFLSRNNSLAAGVDNFLTVDVNNANSGVDLTPKQPTPLLGSWADVWESRQCSEIILEDLNEKKESETIMPAKEEESDDEGMEEYPTATTEQDEEEQPLVVPTPTPERVETVKQQHEDAHLRHKFINNPYAVSCSRQDYYVCQCAECVAMNRQEHQHLNNRREAALRGPEVPSQKRHNTTSFSAPVVEAPLPIKLSSPAGVPQKKGGFETHSVVPPPPPHAPRPAVVRVSAYGDYQSAAPNNAQLYNNYYEAPQESTVEAPASTYTGSIQPAPCPPQLSYFMPPPPPSMMTRELLERSGSTNVEAFFYNTFVRWYSKVLNVQHYFVYEQDLCPTPDEIVDFEEWVVAVTEWWFHHFEFAQMKPQNQVFIPHHIRQPAAAPQHTSAAPSSGPVPPRPYGYSSQEDLYDSYSYSSPSPSAHYYQGMGGRYQSCEQAAAEAW